MVFVSRVNGKHARQAAVPLDLYSTKIRSFVSFQAVPNLNPASVSSRLDYCTCLFLGLVQRSTESHLRTFAIFWLFFVTLFMLAKSIFKSYRHRLGWQISVYYQGSSDLLLHTPNQDQAVDRGHTGILQQGSQSSLIASGWRSGKQFNVLFKRLLNMFSVSIYPTLFHRSYRKSTVLVRKKW